jgi:hypothetical protein
MSPSVEAAPVRKPAPTKTAAKTPPAPIKPSGSSGVSPTTLASALKGIGYPARPEGPYQQVRIEEEKFGYTIDLGFSKSGEWLVCMAHLAPVGDLTAVKSTPLLNLLAANDSLLGMAFSYDRINGRVMLNASVPAKGLDATGLRRLLERMQLAVHENQGLWDTSLWQ